MASKITLKNLEQQEFTIQHPDGVGAGTIKSTDITYKIDSVDDFASVPSAFDTVIVKDKDRGGVFNKITSTTANNGTIFDGNGCSWERQYNGAVNVKWFGVDGLNDSSVLSSLISSDVLDISNSTLGLESKVDFQPNKISIIGDVNNSNINNSNGGYLRFGAVGSANREITNISGINFTGEGKIIDAQAVFPINIKDSRFYNLGLEAIKYYQIYYGKMLDNIFFASQLSFNNVNNYTIDGTDFHGEPSLSKFNSDDFAVLLNNCDRITFSNLTFEGFKNRVIKISEFSNVVTLNNVWFEANTSDTVIVTEGSSIININDSFLDLYPSPINSFIHLDNTNVNIPNYNLMTTVNIKGSRLRLSTSYSSNFSFMLRSGAGSGIVNIDDCVIPQGCLLVSPDVDVNMSRCSLAYYNDESSTSHVFLESVPNATLLPEYNSWIPESANSSEWDFVSGNGFTGTLSFATTTTVGEFLTGTKGIKATIPSDNTEYVFSKNMSNMGPITTEGEVHTIFVRLKTTDSIKIEFAIEGLYIEYTKIPAINSKNNKWVDYIIKTSPNTTWSQGRQGNPKLKIKTTNNTGANVDLLIDRIDYKTILGDHYLA